jgi:hypothetical protein
MGPIAGVNDSLVCYGEWSCYLQTARRHSADVLIHLVHDLTISSKENISFVSVKY